jgi:hypothetical protein
MICLSNSDGFPHDDAVVAPVTSGFSDVVKPVRGRGSVGSDDL